MSLIAVDDDGDSWLTEYGAIERLITTINTSIEQRDTQNSTSGNFFLIFNFFCSESLIN